ncbi:MAG TPA: DoxX family protein [Saprospiraceae bacterium]|nr:DoxX family protein [Saprospiraceae bacterium]
MNNIFDLVGRILISAIFFYEGIDSVLYAEKMKLTMAEYGITWQPDFLLYSSIVCLMVGATMVIIGYRIRFGVWLLLIYWLPVTFIVYSFWNDPVSEQRLHAILFMKNIAVAGGLLMIAAHGGGKYSIQRLFRVTRIPHE